MKHKIQKYKFHIFALAVALLIISGSIFDSCRQKTIFDKHRCPCVLRDKAPTVKGKVVYFIDSDSVQFSFISDEYYEKEIGYIYK